MSTPPFPSNMNGGPSPREQIHALEASGVPHLDLVLGGGLPKGSLIAVLGPSGSGKTTLVCQIAFAAASRGQRVLLLTALSETTDKLIEQLQGFRFYDPEVFGTLVQVFSMQQFLTLEETKAIQGIVAAVRHEQATMVILDGFKMLRDLAADTPQARRLLYSLGTRLSLQGVTTLITSETDPRDPAFFPEMTTADGLIGLYYTLEGVRPFQSLEVVKLRGRAPLLGRHSLLLNAEGLQVFPRLESQIRTTTVENWTAVPEHLTPQTRASFGLPELDGLLGGGLTRQTSSLLVGSLGVGKTLLALQFALAGVSEGEPVLFLGFRETGQQLIQKADAFALAERVRTALASDKLLFQRWEPVEQDPDRMATVLLDALDRMGARRLVIDSITELTQAVEESNGPERVANYLAALLAALRTRGITLLALKEVPKETATHLDFSADVLGILSENMLMMQQIVYRGRRHRILAVLKMRFSAHETRLREVLIGPPQGIRILSPEESGVEIIQGLNEQQMHEQENVVPLSPPTTLPVLQEPGQPALAILVADDEEPVLELLEELVRDLGYQPLLAHNRRQALQMAREQLPALVLTDLMMPMLSGADFITALRAEAESGGKPAPAIVLLTAANLQAAGNLQVDAVITKPFDLRTLEQTIQHLLASAPNSAI